MNTNLYFSLIFSCFIIFTSLAINADTRELQQVIMIEQETVNINTATAVQIADALNGIGIQKLKLLFNGVNNRVNLQEKNNY